MREAKRVFLFQFCTAPTSRAVAWRGRVLRAKSLIGLA